VQELAGAEDADVVAVMDGDDDTCEVEVPEVELDEELRLEVVEKAAVELEFETMVLLAAVAVADIGLVTATIDDEDELEVVGLLAELGWLLAQTSWVSPISQIPGVNPPKTRKLIAFGLAPVKRHKGTVNMIVLPVILVGTK
jgi:hypothetical protein